MGFVCLVCACSQGDRGLMGPPGENPTILITPHMKEVMKGVKGDHGKIGDAGFTGPRGNFTHVNLLLKGTKNNIFHVNYRSNESSEC